MQFIGLMVNPFPPFNKPEPTNQELKEMIDKVHELGGLVTVNHIPWSNSTGAELLFLLLSHRDCHHFC